MTALIGNSLRMSSRKHRAAVVLGIICLSLIWSQHVVVNLVRKSARQQLVDVRAILSHVPVDRANFSFTESDASEKDFATLGWPALTVAFNDSDIFDVRSGHLLVNAEGSTFNLAILKLPHKSKWGFVGVARAPTRVRQDVQIFNNPSREQSLVA